jgi:hypothetical protein
VASTAHPSAMPSFVWCKRMTNVAFLLPSAPVAGVNEYTLINPSHHRGKVVDFKNEHPVPPLQLVADRRLASAGAASIR